MSVPAPRPLTTPRAATCHTFPLSWDGDLLPWLPRRDGLIWLRGGDGFVAWGEALRIEVGSEEGRFRRAAEQLAHFFRALDVRDEVGEAGTGPLAFGSFTFDAPSPGSVLVVPEVVVGRRHGRAWLTILGDTPRPTPALAEPSDHGRVRYEGSSLSELAWVEAVDRIVRRIRTGDVDKVVLARDRRVWARKAFDARLLATRLARRFPTCWTFSCDGLVGASPELLVRREGDAVASTVLAGSAPRGRDDEDDRRLGHGLLTSRKDLEEHAPAVASVRDVLAPLSEALDVDGEPYLLRLANIQHLATDVRATIPAGPTALDLAARLHPTAAVCGTPTRAALENIRDLEHMDRGRYSGPVGWVDARGDGEWAIALRCAQLDGARARLFAGAGIVAESLPEAELEETRVKLAAMQSAFEG